ncbi:MAG: ATP-binding protein [Actinobacteria bacterium]|nr:ATP-binding protein [Actinomycetota bacterium]
MSLRARILLGMGAIVALLVVAGFGVFRAQSATLLGQVDVRLESLRQPALAAAAAIPADPSNVRGRRTLDGLYVGRVSTGGELVTTLAVDAGTELKPVLNLPIAFGIPVTVDTTGGDGTRMRVIAYAAPGREVAVLGQPLNDIDGALAQLARNLLLMGALLFAVIALVTWWVMRLGVGPITQVAAVARAVRAGDREQRVPDFPAGTEAQELGQSFNVLVDSNIAAEARLRQFVADASHELRTPLATLTGYTSLYAAGGLASDEAVGDAMRRMRQEAQRMNSLVDDLLLLAEADRGLEPRRESVDLVPLITGLVTDARVLSPSRVIDLEVPASAVVTGDPDRLTQVIGILVDNARKHTPEGSPIEVTISATSGNWRVEVVDHGPGLQADDAAHVFDRFYRAESARTRATGGSGLGLAIASALVTAHAGRIGVQSPAGGGSIFWVELPTANPADDPHENRR